MSISLISYAHREGNMQQNRITDNVQRAQQQAQQQVNNDLFQFQLVRDQAQWRQQEAQREALNSNYFTAESLNAFLRTVVNKPIKIGNYEIKPNVQFPVAGIASFVVYNLLYYQGLISGLDANMIALATYAGTEGLIYGLR